MILFEDNIVSWDLSKKPQLQINICRQEQGDLVIIGMSHILTDGAGFLQYLYLLSGLYNGKSPDMTLRNHREPGPFLKNIHIRRQSEQTRRGKRKKVSPLRATCQDTHSFCLISRISEEDFLLLHEKAQKSHVTLNDVFMTAYARVISKMKNMDTVVIPCPADLRRFRPEADELTVANLTGIYRRVTVEINPQDSFHATLWQVHIEMKLQRARQRCFAGVPLLNWAYHRIPRPLLGQVIKANYPLLPVSYTNMGQIDHGKLSFSHCRIMSCYLTGTYRKSPDFQLSISTFQNVCTLNCTLMGEEGDDLKGQYILDQVKKEILEWVPVVK